MNYGYERRNQRIRNESALVDHRNMLVDAEKEKYEQHYIAQLEKHNQPLQVKG
jgi:hypothetical protein